MLGASEYAIYAEALRLEREALTNSNEAEPFALRYRAREQWLLLKNVLHEAQLDAPNESDLCAALCYTWSAKYRW